MRLTVDRYSMQIIPETKQDEAYIEEVLGLKKGGDCIAAERIDAMGLSCIAYVEMKVEIKKGD